MVYYGTSIASARSQQVVQEINFHLKDISLTLQPGEIIGLIGKNGSGKSTLINTLVGNRFKDSGDFIFDQVISDKDHAYKEHIGVVFDDLRVPDKLEIKDMDKVLRIFSKRGTVIVSLKSFVSNYQLTFKLKHSQEECV